MPSPIRRYSDIMGYSKRVFVVASDELQRLVLLDRSRLFVHEGFQEGALLWLPLGSRAYALLVEHNPVVISLHMDLEQGIKSIYLSAASCQSKEASLARIKEMLSLA